MTSGPDFSTQTKETLAKRAAQTCSNPDCRRRTSGPHTDDDKSVNLGEAAHIKAAREGVARYDPNMTDEERSHISNGIWLCRECAGRIDRDEERFPVELLQRWKKEHEDSVLAGERGFPAREVKVTDGGVGSIIHNTGDGTALEIVHNARGPAERISVQGSGVGEIITNTGRGTAKRIINTGGGSGSESSVTIDRPVRMAAGLSASVCVVTCERCGNTFQFSKVIQGFAGDSEPRVQVTCPNCGASMSA